MTLPGNEVTERKYNPAMLIRKKRDAHSLTGDEIRFLVNEYSADRLPDYQMSAFLMAAFFNELDEQETSALTQAMLYSGKVLDLSDVPGVKVDKHSTGGVGDKLSLILAPIVAACGVPVPMISGRGLGHSGGTLDKLESIPGFNVNLDLKRYVEVLMRHNLVLIGQTEEIAPADKRMYALRDVTATVESVPLIAASIMSKKLAEGIDALVLDVKFGSGAFMQRRQDAERLAGTLVAIGESFGKETVAYITDMDQPLGYKIGNWLEVEESIDALQGRGAPDIMEISIQLAGTMIWLGKRAGSVEEGKELSRRVIEDGRAFQKFVDLTDEQGGDTKVLLKPETYPAARLQFDIQSPEDGFIGKLNAYDFGMAAVELGAGRKVKEDSVDPAAGIRLFGKVGDKVKKGETIARCFTNNNYAVDHVRNRLVRAVEISAGKPSPRPLIASVMGGSWEDRDSLL